MFALLSGVVEDLLCAAVNFSASHATIQHHSNITALIRPYEHILHLVRGQSDMLEYLCRPSSALFHRVRLHLLGTVFGGQVLPLH